MPLQFGRSALRLTVARYFRPSDKNIHRKPDATEEDEWGVTPNEGFTVAIDEETLVKLDERWKVASYPLLRDTDTGEPTNTETSENSPNDVEQSNLDFDPQLRKAFDHLMRQIDPEAYPPGIENQETPSSEPAKVAA